MVTPHKLSVPVICVGNIVMGGAGKTPVVIALVQLLQAMGHTPHILSRGYGGTIRQATRVEAMHTAAQVGDEPLLLAKHAPCWVGKDRYETASIAIDAGADVLLMDDGLQNPSLYQDVSLLVLDGGYGLGNGTTFPAGPLRETLQNACDRAQVVLVIGQDQQQIIPRLPGHVQLLRGVVQPSILDQIQARSVVAFAGIGRPEKFYGMLREYQMDVVQTHDFSDHHPYTSQELESLAMAAKEAGALLVTTEKDWVRLDDAWKAQVTPIPIQLELSPKEIVLEIMQKVFIIR